MEEVLIAKGFRGISTVCALPLDPGIYRPRGLEEDLKLIPRANDETIIGYVGRLVEAKGLRTLVDSLGSLQDLSWRLVVIGTGEFEATFRRLLTEGGIINRVVFSGYVPHAETPRYLSAFDVLVVPSETQPNWKEQFGRVITEAMSCGTPVIGSSSGEIPNLIRKSNGGLIFPEKNAAEFAKCLRQMITQKDSRQKLGENGRKWVESEVSLSAVAKNGHHFGDGHDFGAGYRLRKKESVTVILRYSRKSSALLQRRPGLQHVMAMNVSGEPLPAVLGR